MPPRRSTAVRIQGQEYRIRSESEPDAVERAARFVDETMDRIRDRTGAVDSLDVAVLTALNMANQLIALRDGQAVREADLAAHGVDPERLRDLIDRIESAGGDAPEAH